MRNAVMYIILVGFPRDQQGGLGCSERFQPESDRGSGDIRLSPM
jgi:hypothetical protein